MLINRLKKSERQKNYLESVENFDQVDTFNGDLIRATADMVMVYKTKALSSTLLARNGSIAFR